MKIVIELSEDVVQDLGASLGSTVSESLRPKIHNWVRGQIINRARRAAVNQISQAVRDRYENTTGVQVTTLEPDDPEYVDEHETDV